MSNIKILAIGDVVGQSGCDILKEKLPYLKHKYNIDVTIVNGENSAQGNGIHKKSAEQIFNFGADVITTGNHGLKRPEVYDKMENNPFLLRPANYPQSVVGKGLAIIDKGSYKVAVINLMGVVYLENLDCPFNSADREIKKAKDEGADIIIIDFHAEATSEKKAMGFYLDGRISALFGTHTHVQTADDEILPNGTGYITDIGMTGPSLSVLGIDPVLAIKKQKEKIPVRFDYPDTPPMLNGVIFTIDKESKKTVEIERIVIK
jgi:metallophosphoesterase (TIGR00282 family)